MSRSEVGREISASADLHELELFLNLE